MDGLKRGSAAIVGVAESDLGQVADGMSVTDLMAQGTRRALDDCGLSLKDIDGLFCATAQSRLSVLGLALGGLAFAWPENRPIPKALASVGYLVGAGAAAILAWGKALRGERNPIWEPTRR